MLQLFFLALPTIASNLLARHIPHFLCLHQQSMLPRNKSYQETNDVSYRRWEPITAEHHGPREERYLGIYLLGDITHNTTNQGETMNLGRYFLGTNHCSWYHWSKGDWIHGIQATDSEIWVDIGLVCIRWEWYEKWNKGLRMDIWLPLFLCLLKTKRTKTYNKHTFTQQRQLSQYDWLQELQTWYLPASLQAERSLRVSRISMDEKLDDLDTWQWLGSAPLKTGLHSLNSGGPPPQHRQNGLGSSLCHRGFDPNEIQNRTWSTGNGLSSPGYMFFLSGRASEKEMAMSLSSSILAATNTTRLHHQRQMLFLAGNEITFSYFWDLKCQMYVANLERLDYREKPWDTTTRHFWIWLCIRLFPRMILHQPFIPDEMDIWFVSHICIYAGMLFVCRRLFRSCRSQWTFSYYWFLHGRDCTMAYGDVDVWQLNRTVLGVMLPRTSICLLPLTQKAPRFFSCALCSTIRVDILQWYTFGKFLFSSPNTAWIKTQDCTISQAL